MTARRWMMAAAIGVAVLQIGFLVSMIAGRAAILRSGQDVVLEVRPVDPRDLLRGDYVILGYNISSIPVDLFDAPLSKTQDSAERSVYVRLKADEDGIWQPVAARYDEKPEPAAAEGEVDIRGTTSARWFEDSTQIPLDYGIERFYVPEGEGKAIERDMSVRSFRMKVAVAEDGTAQIKSFHDGETMLYAEPIY